MAEPYRTKFRRVPITDKAGQTALLGLPIGERATESEKTLFEEIMNQLKDEGNWKTETNFGQVSTRAEADIIARALEYYTGGAEILHMNDGSYLVHSKGYYHYIGA